MSDHGIEGVGEIDANELLDQLAGANVHDVGSEEVGFSCFYIAGHANGDENPSAHINRDSLLWHCKGCGRAGNVTQLVRDALPHGTTIPTIPEALAWLREHFGEVVRQPLGGSLAADLARRLEKPAVIERTLPIEGDTIGPGGIFAMDWRSDHDAAVYMREVRGFDPAVLEDWCVGYDHWTKRVAIPIRRDDGVLAGFKGRTIHDVNPKYLLLGDTDTRAPRYGVGYGFDMHDATSVVFGLDRASAFAPGCLTVVEGELDAIACHAAGVTNTVAIGTTSITAEQLWFLRAHANTLVLFYDSDKAGLNAVRSLVRRLNGYFRLYVVDRHKGDPASMAPEVVRDLVREATHWLSHPVLSESSV